MTFDFPNGWQLQSVEDSMKAIIDYRGKTPRKTPSGVPLITAKIVKDGRIMPPTEFIASEGYDSWMNRGLPEPGDVVMTTEAPLGEIAQINNRKVALGQRLITLRGKPDVLNNTYLKFAMQAAFVQNQLKARSTGTTVLGISQRELREVEIPIPSLSEQRRIAHILGTLDEKIELNRQMNETLEATARAIFKSWFVDFDPVKAKVEGHKPACMDTETAALFPAAFQDSSLGKIPKGWKVRTFGEIAENVRRSVKASEIDSSECFLGLEHMPRRSITLLQWETASEIQSNKYRFRKGEILLGKLNPHFHKVGVAPIDGICSTDILVIQPVNAGWFGVVLGLVSSDNFVAYTSAHARGTTLPRTNWKDMSRYKIALPNVEIAKKYAEFIQPIINKIIENIHQSRTLAQTRDALLPKLLSGEIRVDDASEMLEVTYMPQQTVPNIESLRVKNYRALRDIELKQLKPLTVFLGPNGSGKSTLFDVFAFLCECFTVGLGSAWNKRGGLKELRTRGCNGPIEFELKYREESKSPIMTYHLSIDEGIKGPFVDTEWLQWRPGRGGKHIRFLDFYRGVGSVIAGETPDEENEQINEQLDDPSALAANMFGQLARHPRVGALRHFITDWHLSDLSTDATRQATNDGPQKRLSTTGDNLPNVIQYLQERYPERLEKIISSLSNQVPRLEKVDTELMMSGRRLLKIKDAPFDQPILAKFASDGTLKLLSYLTLFHAPQPPQLIGIEEPENYLHPRLLTGLADACRKAVMSSQFIITTHSSRFVNELYPDEVWVFYRDEQGFTVCKRASEMLGINEFMEAGAKLGQLWMEGFFEFGDPLTNAGGPKRGVRAH